MATCGANMGGWAKGWNPTFKKTQRYTQNSPPGSRKLSLWSKRKWKLKERQGLTQGCQAKGWVRGGRWGDPSLPLETGYEKLTFPRVLISPVFPSPGLGTDRRALGWSHGQGFNLASPPQDIPCARAAGISAISWQVSQGCGRMGGGWLGRFV